LQAFLDASVEEGGDVGDFGFGERHRRHAFVGATLADDIADQITFDIVRGDRRTE
jgi:hypothetical protein